MADPKDYTLVRMDDSIPDNAVLAYDALNDTIVDSGLTAHFGELQAGADSVAVGLQTMSSAGEQVVWENQHTSVVYAPPWHIVDEVNTEGSRDRVYGILQDAVVFSDKSGVVENPINNINVPENGIVFSYTITFPEARDNVELQITYLDPSDPLLPEPPKALWRELRNVSAGENVISLTLPNALYTGSYYFRIQPVVDSEPPVKVAGNPQTGEFAYNTKFRTFREIPLATKEYVDAAVTGSPASDIMTKAVYDTDNDGKVDEAAHADKAATIDGGPSATNNQFYGKDANGVLGFHTITPSGTIPDTANKVYVKEFTTPTYTLSSKELDTDRVPYYVYTGTVDASFALPHLSNMEPESIIFGIMNNSDNKLSISLRSGDGWNGDDSIKAYEMAAHTGIVVVSDLAQTTWFVVATMDVGHFRTFEDKLLILEAELKKHETSIDAHGVTLATQASQIHGADSTANSALTLAQQNAETIVTNRKNAIKGVTFEQDKAAKTITLKFISDSGVVDTGTIDLTGWFDGGGTVPSSDHKIYYGFASHVPIAENDILRLGTAKTVPTVSGLDIDLQRSSQSSSFIYVWLPDSVGTVKGFTFSGFLSVWNSTALTIAGAPGKFFSSPNRTSATHVNFEVTQ